MNYDENVLDILFSLQPKVSCICLIVHLKVCCELSGALIFIKFMYYLKFSQNPRVCESERLGYILFCSFCYKVFNNFISNN